MEVWSLALGKPRTFHGGTIDGSWRLEPQLDYLRDNLLAIESACTPARLPDTLDELAAAAHATAAIPARVDRRNLDTDQVTFAHAERTNATTAGANGGG